MSLRWLNNMLVVVFGIVVDLVVVMLVACLCGYYFLCDGCCIVDYPFRCCNGCWCCWVRYNGISQQHVLLGFLVYY